MVFGDLMGFSDSDYAYNQTRAHSADIFFLKMMGPVSSKILPSNPI